MTGFLARQQRFDAVGSTNDVVRAWLAEGTPEVCLAVADEQTAGRGRAGRRWLAPRGRALLLSLGFRPGWLDPERTWRLAAIAALAMADAAEEVAGLADGAIRLKWPNDLVVEDARRVADGGPAGTVRKIGGLLGETDGLGTADPRAVIGLGINADWPASEFPSELAETMTSLREASHGRPIDLALLLDAFVGRIEARVEALRGGRFDVADWQARQVTTGRIVRLERPDGGETVRALGVDVSSGALLVEDEAVPGGERSVIVGEVTHVRLAMPAGTGV
jgi:BirA family biotin operon repressor/biotin-[acetyl-CoA-carboxylase] ligase